ncbi:MAG: sporulation protein YunB [Christensenellales bacterium]
MGNIKLLKLAQKFKLTKKRLVSIFVVILISIIIMLIFSFMVNPVIMDTVEIKSMALATRAMNSSIADVVMNSIVYDDLVNIISDDFGNITMIQANSLEINNLSKDLAQTCEERIGEYGNNGVTIPLGTFTGIPLLVGRGPRVKVKMTPIGSVICKFVSHFESAGINQTIHKIYVNITATVSVVMPLSSRSFQAVQQVLISESVIVGQVPEVYLQSDTLDTLLNFVPY